MSILEQVSKLFSVDVKKPPALESDIKALLDFSPIKKQRAGCYTHPSSGI